MIGESVAFLRSQASACCSMPSTSSTASSSMPATRSTACAPRSTPAPSASCCATPTAARYRRRSARRSPSCAKRCPAQRSASTPRRLRLRGRQHADRRRSRRDTGPGHDHGIGERTGNANLITIIADLQLSGRQAARAGAARAADRDGALRRRAAEPLAEPGAAVRRKARVRAQGRSARGRRTRRLRPSSTSTRRSSATTATCWSPSCRAGHGDREGKAGGIAAGEQASAQRIVERVKELEHEGFQFEAADGSFELLMRKEAG